MAQVEIGAADLAEQDHRLPGQDFADLVAVGDAAVAAAAGEQEHQGAEFGTQFFDELQGARWR
jgi:hypothetical protein